MTPAELLARVHAGAPRLAELIVADALATPLGELVPPAHDVVVAAAHAVAADGAAEQALVARAATLLAALPAARLGELLPDAVIAGAMEIAALPFRVPRALMTRLLSREPVRQLLRAQILRTLVEFGRKVTSPFTENPVARGLSRLAFGDKKKPTPLGTLRSAVSGEAEKRAADFADTAVDEVIDGIADQLADPARAREQAAIRVALLEALLDETGSDLAALARPELAPAVAAARRAVAAWRPTLRADLAAAVEVVLAAEAARPIGDILADFGLREVVAEHATRLVTARMERFIRSDPFAKWLDDLLT